MLRVGAPGAGRFCGEMVAVKVLEFEVPARLAHTRLAEISIVTSLRHPCVVCRALCHGLTT